MKIQFVCFKFSKVFFLVICMFLILIISFLIHKIILNQKKLNFEEKYIDIVDEKNNTTIEKETQKKYNDKTKTRLMQKKLKGFEIVGKIEIPKLKVEKYILSNTTTKSLKVSVTKVCGPDINKIGNFCIAGHNYNKIFGKIKTLEKKDKIILTDVYGDSIIYEIYDIYKTSPQDTSCLNQDTNSEKELTLITCTAGATKRVIVKAVEIYD